MAEMNKSESSGDELMKQVGSLNQSTEELNQTLDQEDRGTDDASSILAAIARAILKWF